VLKDLFEQGIGLWRREEWEVAAEVFARAQALEISNEQVRSFHGRARIRADSVKASRELAGVRAHLEAGRVEAAQAGLVRVLELEPSNKEAKVLQDSLGGAPLSAERRAQAREHFNKGVDLYGRAQWADAVREWEVVVSIDRKDREARSLLEKARAKIRTAKKGAGKRIESLHAEALILYQLGKAGEARAKYAEILVLDPDDAKARASLTLIEGSK